METHIPPEELAGEVMLLAKAHLHTTNLEEAKSPENLGQGPVGHNWVCAVVRLKGATVILAAVHLPCQIEAKGTTEPNLSL